MSTPALWARHISNGEFQIPKHISFLDRAIYNALTGKGPKRIAVNMPPRHGKSYYLSEHVPAWMGGMYPDNQTILASYEADFASEWGEKARALLETHKTMFGVEIHKSFKSKKNWRIKGHRGGMKTAGVGGPMTGKGAHCLLIDDPIKNSEEAMSETISKKQWDWFRSTAYSRLEPGGIIVLVQTRWSMLDLTGRIIAEMEAGGEPWLIVSFPAIAEEHDILGREPGEALWPERYSIETLNMIKSVQGPYWWSSLYQQRPTPLEGGLFKLAWFDKLYDDAPVTSRSCRFWDLASTKGDGDYTVGLLIDIGEDGLFYIRDVVRGQWEPYERDRVIRATAELDGYECKIRMEKEPGASGESLILAMHRLLVGYDFKGIRSRDSKMARVNSVDGVASQAGVGRVRIMRATWNKAFLDELILFPNGRHDDQVDSLSGAFNTLTRERIVMVS